VACGTVCDTTGDIREAVVFELGAEIADRRGAGIWLDMTYFLDEIESLAENL